MNDVQKIYNEMWEDGAEALRNSSYAIDSYIDDIRDSRRGITVLIRLNVNVAKSIESFIRDLQSIEPDQYYYSISELHVTILSVVSARENFQLEHSTIEQYRKIFSEICSQFPPFLIQFKGITVSERVVMIQGFPKNNILNELRDALRNALIDVGHEKTFDVRYVLKAAHVTTVRYRQSLKNSKDFLDRIASYRNTDFGESYVESIDLVFNDWYMRKDQVQVLHSFPLKKL